MYTLQNEHKLEHGVSMTDRERAVVQSNWTWKHSLATQVNYYARNASHNVQTMQKVDIWVKVLPE